MLGHGADRDDGADIARQRAPHGIGGGPEINCQVEPAQHQGEPFRHVGRDPLDQKRCWPERRGAPAACAAEHAIEDVKWL